jgi:hypothetical protein
MDLVLLDTAQHQASVREGDLGIQGRVERAVHGD